MLAIRNLLRTNPRFAKNVIQQRNMSVTAVPARNKVTKAEIITLVGLMVTGWLTVPVWVLLHIKEYRSKD